MVFLYQDAEAAEEVRFIRAQLVGKNSLIELMKNRHRVKFSAGKIIVAAFASDLLIVSVCKLGGFLIELVQMGI